MSGWPLAQCAMPQELSSHRKRKRQGQDVEIPSANLRTPYMYDSAQERWVWLYRDEETNESVNYFYDKDRFIRFRVTGVHFAEARQNRRAMSIVGAAWDTQTHF
eukprot:Skav209421  [mRNA]  locus=scaffold1411:370252:375015:+ [translate_table: standard]